MRKRNVPDILEDLELLLKKISAMLELIMIKLTEVKKDD